VVVGIFCSENLGTILKTYRKVRQKSGLFMQ